MNVLIYCGEGTSSDSVRQSKECLHGLLSPYYSVSTVTAQQLAEEPWAPSTVMLVIPGGADLPYCRSLNGVANDKIQHFVRNGGIYIGICAGAYYASKSIEFEKGTSMEVSGPRELGFYNGFARGTVFKGFVYGSDKGARASKLSYEASNVGDPKTTVVYYNGGCMFEGDDDAKVLARYVGPVEIESADAHPASIVLKSYGKGKVLLSGVHFEYDLDEKELGKRDILPQVVKGIYEARQSRRDLLVTLFSDNLGLKVRIDGSPAVPKLSSLHLTSLRDSEPSVSTFLNNMESLVSSSGVLEDVNDTFRLVDEANSGHDTFTSGALDEKEKLIDIYKDGHYPSHQRTPFFNHSIYYAELASFIAKRGIGSSKLGALVLYGEVVTSTSTMLERNPQLLRRAPHGLVAVATQQVAGRGRGSNVWVNPVGVMAVSGVIRIPQSQFKYSLVFFQYLVSMAIIKAVSTFIDGKDIGLRIKWPNDIYIKFDNESKPSSLAKIGGVIVSCQSIGSDLVAVFGSGVNVDNRYPTVSINSVIDKLNAGPQIQIEKLLARYLTILDEMLQNFLVSGFGVYEKLYKELWLHSGASVILERYGNARATIKGISLDTGMLIAEDAHGMKYELQADGNSFDMLRGLIRRKT